MRAILFRMFAALVAAVLAAGAVVLIVMGLPWEAVPVVAICALFSGYVILGEEHSQWMLTLVFGIPANSLRTRQQK